MASPFMLSMPLKKRIPAVKSGDMSSLTEDSGHYAYLHNFTKRQRPKATATNSSRQLKRQQDY